MNKILLVSIIVVIIIIFAGVYFMYANNKGPVYNYNTPVTTETNNVPSTNVPNNVQNQQQTAPASLTGAVTIQNFSFNPATLTIKVGTTVTWTNADPMPHQIKSNTFNSAALNSGETFQFTFSSVGSYDYSCAIHPSMKGKIIVTN